MYDGLALHGKTSLGMFGSFAWEDIYVQLTDIPRTPCESIQGKPISSLLVENTDCFQRAIETMKRDDRKSYKIRFAVTMGSMSAFAQDPVEKAIAAETEGFRPEEVDEVNNILDMEGQGILIFDRTDGEASHVSFTKFSFTIDGSLT